MSKFAAAATARRCLGNTTKPGGALQRARVGLCAGPRLCSGMRHRHAVAADAFTLPRGHRHPRVAHSRRVRLTQRAVRQRKPAPCNADVGRTGLLAQRARGRLERIDLLVLLLPLLLERDICKLGLAELAPRRG